MSAGINYGDLVFLPEHPEFVFFAIDQPTRDGLLPVTLSYLRRKNGAFIRLPNRYSKDISRCFNAIHRIVYNQLSIDPDRTIPVLRLPIERLSLVSLNSCDHSFSAIRRSLVNALPVRNGSKIALRGSHAINVCKPNSDVDFVVNISAPLPTADNWVQQLLDAGFRQAPMQASYTVPKGLGRRLRDEKIALLNQRNPSKFVFDGQVVDIHLANPRPSRLEREQTGTEEMTVTGLIYGGVPHAKPSTFVLETIEMSQEDSPLSYLQVVSYLHATRLLRIGDVVTIEGLLSSTDIGLDTLILCDLQCHEVTDLQPDQWPYGGKGVGSRP